MESTVTLPRAPVVPRGPAPWVAWLPLASGSLACLGAALPGEIRPEVAVTILPALWGAAALAILVDPAVPRWLMGWSLVMAVVQATSAWASGDGDVWRPAVAIVMMGLLAVQAGSRARHADLRGWLLLPVGAVTLVVLWAGGWQLLGGFDETRRQVLAAEGLDVVERSLMLARLDLGRPFGPFSLPGVLGGFLAGVTMVLGGAAFDGGMGLPIRIALAIPAAGAGLLLLATRSSGALAAAAAAFLLAAAGRAGDARRRRLLGLLLVAVALLGAVLSLRRHADGDRRGSVALRVENWRAALAMWEGHPWLGVGTGGFGHHYPRAVAETGNLTKHAHSIAARTLAECGLLGFVALVGLGVTIARHLRVAAAAASRPADLGWILGAITLGLHALVDIDMDLESLGVLTPFIIGVAVAPSTLRSPSTFPSRLLGAGLVAGAALALPPYVAHARGRVAIEQAAHLAREGERASARDELRRAAVLDPRSATAHLLLGTELLAQGDVAAATACLERAASLSPERGRIRLVLALAHAAGGRRAEACREARAAARMLPLDAEARETQRRSCGEAGRVP